MTERITVRTQLWARVLIILGLPLLSCAGAYTLWLTIASGFQPLFKSVLQIGTGIFCVVAVFNAIPLLRFLRHNVVLHSDGIEIASGNSSRFFLWGQIGVIKVSVVFNILRVYDQAGNLIYAVDFYAENFWHLVDRLSEPSPASALTSQPTVPLKEKWTWSAFLQRLRKRELTSEDLDALFYKVFIPLTLLVILQYMVLQTEEAGFYWAQRTSFKWAAPPLVALCCLLSYCTKPVSKSVYNKIWRVLAPVGYGLFLTYLFGPFFFSLIDALTGSDEPVAVYGPVVEKGDSTGRLGISAHFHILYEGREINLSVPYFKVYTKFNIGDIYGKTMYRGSSGYFYRWNRFIQKPLQAASGFKNLSTVHISGNTQVCIVPMDDFPEIYSTKLASELSQDLGLKVVSMPVMGTRGIGAYNEANQFSAEQVVDFANSVLQRLSDNRNDTVFILMTMKDINLQEGNLNFLFAWHQKEKKMSVVSAARLRTDIRAWTENKTYERVYKFTKRAIGEQSYGLKRSADINDIMYSPIKSLEDVDKMGKDFIELNKSDIIG